MDLSWVLLGLVAVLALVLVFVPWRPPEDHGLDSFDVPPPRPVDDPRRPPTDFDD